MRRQRTLGLILTVAMALVTTPGEVRSQQTEQWRGHLTEEFHQTYQLAPGGRVALENINGGVKIRAWDRNEVKVDAIKYAYTQERLQEATIRVNAMPQAVSIETDFARDSFTWHKGMSEEERRRNQPATVEYTLTVPRAARIDEVKLINGGIDVEGLAGEVNASSINGRVAGRGLTGEIKLSTINGRLDVVLERLDETKPVSLGSVNGPVYVTIPSDANAELRANTVHGSIRNEFGLPVKRGEYVGQDLAGMLGRGGVRVKLSNVNGAIIIRRAQDGRPMSQVTNMLSETRDREGDYDYDGDAEVQEAGREASRAAREAAREVRQAQREAQREAQQERQQAIREAQREQQESIRDATREAQEHAREIAREASRIAREAVSEIEPVHVHGESRQIERVSNTLQVSATPRVRLENFGGPVVVRAWDKSEVMYTAVKRAYDEREMKGIKINTQSRNDTTRTNNAGRTTSASAQSDVMIKTEFDPAFSREIIKEDGKIKVYSSNASVELEVYVPRNSILNVHSNDGRLRVEGVEGEIQLRTGDGGIEVSKGRGRLHAQTGDGRIHVADFNGETDVTTGDGRIALEGSFTRLTARTGDGSILLSIPADASATIETNAETVVSDGFAVEETPGDVGRRARRWRVGGGGQTYTLRTGDGQIILRRR